MAENPRNSFLTKEKCSLCGLQPAVFLHYVWHKGRYLHICTACILNLHKAAFCSICFEVYDDPNNLFSDRVKCFQCEATGHLACIPSLFGLYSSTAGTFGASSSTNHQGCVFCCPFCSNPDFKIFNFGWHERTRSVTFDRDLVSQLLAAAIISSRSMKKALKMASFRANILCKEAAEAREKAIDAVHKLHDLTLGHQGENRSEYVLDDDGEDDEEDEDEDDASDD